MEKARSFHDLSLKQDATSFKGVDLLERFKTTAHLHQIFKKASRELRIDYINRIDIAPHAYLNTPHQLYRSIKTGIITVDHPNYPLSYFPGEENPATFISPTNDRGITTYIVPVQAEDQAIRYAVFANYDQKNDDDNPMYIEPAADGFYYLDAWRYLLNIRYRMQLNKEDLPMRGLFSENQPMYCLSNKVLRQGLGEVQFETGGQIVTIRSPMPHKGASLELPLARDVWQIQADLVISEDGRDIHLYNHPAYKETRKGYRALSDYWAYNDGKTIYVERTSETKKNRRAVKPGDELKLKVGDIVELGEMEGEEDVYIALQAYADPEEKGWRRNKLGIAIYPYRLPVHKIGKPVSYRRS